MKVKAGDIVKVKVIPKNHNQFQHFEKDIGKELKVRTVEDGYVKLEGAVRFLEEEFVEIVKQQDNKKTSLRKVLREHIGDAINSRSVADFAIRYKIEGDAIFTEAHCHANLRWHHGVKEKGEEMQEIALFMGGYVKHFEETAPEHMETYEKYVHWILNTSPWKDCFKTCSTSVAFTKGVLMNVDKNISELLGAAVALREGWEFYNRLPMFQECLDAGATESVAYLVALYLSADPRRKGQYTLSGMGGGHNTLCGAMDFKATMAFFREGYVPGAPAIRNDPTQTHYAIFNTIMQRAEKNHFAVKDADKITTHFCSAVKPMEEGEGWGKRYYTDKAGRDRLIAMLNKELGIK